MSNARNPLVCAKNGRLHATVRADLPLVTTLFAESAHARRVAAPQAPGETNTDEKRKLLIDGFGASPPESLRVSEFQTHQCTRLDEARALRCLDLVNPWRFEEIAQKGPLERKHQLREVRMRPIKGVNNDCVSPCRDVCHSPPSLPSPKRNGKLRSMLTGTGVGSEFCFGSERMAA